MLKLKDYQEAALATLDGFVSACETLGVKDAFTQTLAAQGFLGIPYRSAPFGEVPCVCLRIPTGGGKTLLGSHAISHLARCGRHRDAPVAVWLTQSDSVRAQTLTALQTPGHPYREALELRYGARLRVLDLEQAATIAPSDAGSAVIVLVANVHAFRVDNTDKRNVYRFNEAFESHFKSLSPEEVRVLKSIPDAMVTAADIKGNSSPIKGMLGQPKYSLTNWLALQRPILIVDEAHNVQSQRSFEALIRLNPSFIMELTATPLPKSTNVLYRVSAQELAAEDMIKLPILLEEHKLGWESAVTDALLRQRQLEAEAQHEKEYIRPIVLFQAQPENESVTVDVLRQYLIDKHNIPESQIARATSKYKELADKDLFSPMCPIRYVITVEALKEGWDCPFAYVLCSLQSVRSAKDAEQLLGRVLRMPYAKRRSRRALNRAYAHALTEGIGDAARAMVDQLVQKMGFERMEAQTSVLPDEPGLFDEDELSPPAPRALPELSIDLPRAPESPLAEGIFTTPLDGGGVRVSVKGFVSAEDEAVLVELAKGDKDKGEVTERIAHHNAVTTAVLSPSLRGLLFSPLPRLALRQQGVLELLEKPLIAELGGLDLLKDKIELPSFAVVESNRGYEIYIDNAKVEYKHSNAQGELNEVSSTQTEAQLLRWLGESVVAVDIVPAQKIRYLTLLLQHLQQEKGITLSGLIRSRFELLRCIERRLDALRVTGVRNGFQSLLLEPASVEAAFDYAFKFEPHRNPARPPYYSGRFRFQKHYFPSIGDLKSTGEEYLCAQMLDSHPAVKHWVRNVAKHPYAFWLPTSGDYFYPDFVCELTDGRILVVEYKGDHLWTGAAEDRQVGALWSEKSDGKCLFIMIRKTDEAGRDMGGQLEHLLSRHG